MTIERISPVCDQFLQGDWHRLTVTRQVAAVVVSVDAPLAALDIGCGAGGFRAHVEAGTSGAWT